MQGGNFAEAEWFYRKAISADSSYMPAHNNLGNALRMQGLYNEALSAYKAALNLAPDDYEIYDSIGITLNMMARFDEAADAFSRAAALAPNDPNVHNNLGVALHELGRMDEAAASYRRALQINPDYAEAHYNLGNTLIELGRLDEAEASYREALEIKPDYADALNNFALLLAEQGKPVMALSTIRQSLLIEETAKAKSIFVDCVKHLRLTRDDSKIRAVMVRALNEPWGRPSDLVQISTGLIKLDPGVGGCVARAADAWPLRLPAQDLFGPNGDTMLADDPLLCAILNSAPIRDIDMERFLTMARRVMLDTAAGVSASDAGVGAASGFYSALARQCFINEYVFSHTEDEIRKAGSLRDSLAAALEANTQAPALWVVAVASYFPLYSITFAVRLLGSQWPDEVAAVLAQQVREPAEELQLRATISRLTDIEGEVSLLVQNQYEKNPYPRWIKAAPAGNAKNLIEYFVQQFPLASLNRHGTKDNIDILIAGCGTGQQSIETAQLFKNAQVLAIDLSMSSLTYAKRKTRELGLTTIEYAQADLLKLGPLGRSFDIIESVGVLHHLADPWAGWRVLLSLLRPGGFMKLGFYSEVARRNIVWIRTFIAERGYGSTAEDIRQFRQDLIELGSNAGFGAALESADFFSISPCRDLLFHVQEHHMTLTEIAAFLRENNLAFLGFEIDFHALHAYKLRFPDDRAATNLDQWQIFENENQDTFLRMYQFWVQKAA